MLRIQRKYTHDKTRYNTPRTLQKTYVMQLRTTHINNLTTHTPL